MSEKPSGRKPSGVEQLMRPTIAEIEGAQIRLISNRSRCIYKLLKCEYEMYERELQAQGKSLWYVGELPIKEPRP